MIQKNIYLINDGKAMFYSIILVYSFVNFLHICDILKEMDDTLSKKATIGVIAVFYSRLQSATNI